MLWMTILLVSWSVALGDPPAPPSESTPGKEGANPASDAPKTPARPDYVRLGTVWFHPGRQEIEVDGFFNLRAGFVEYLAATPGTKRHETLVALECEPEHLHGAILLLGIEPGKGPESELDLRPISGPRVIILLRWNEKAEDGTQRQVERRAEDCLLNGLVEDTMQRVGWVFTGSEFITLGANPPPGGPGGGGGAGVTPPREAGTGEAAGEEPAAQIFGATATGELIAVSHRPLAILDHPLGIPFPDADYYAYPDALPPLDRDNPTRVTLVIRLPRENEIDKSATLMKVPPPPETQPAVPTEGEPKPGGSQGGQRSG